MTGLGSLRERVARAIRADGSDLCDGPWEALSANAKSAWLTDADRAIEVVVEAAARVADQRDPEKPGNYLFKREQIGNVIRGLFLGCEHDEESDDD